MKLFYVKKSDSCWIVSVLGIKIKIKKAKEIGILPITVYLFDDISVEKITCTSMLPKNMKVCVDPRLTQDEAKSNVLKIHKSFRARGVRVEYTYGCTNSLCVLEDSTTGSGIEALIIMMSGDKNELKIDKGTAMNGTKIFLGNGSKCFIGKNCIFSYEITIRTTDGHVILSKDNGQILNEQKVPCVIGDHCWIGMRTIINKNVNIADNTIVGSGSVVTRQFDEQYTVIAGNPAGVIKTGVTFDENTIYTYKKKGTCKC